MFYLLSTHLQLSFNNFCSSRSVITNSISIISESPYLVSSLVSRLEASLSSRLYSKLCFPEVPVCCFGSNPNDLSILLMVSSA